jgi:hypothetical protein
MLYRQNCIRGNGLFEGQKVPHQSYSPDLAITYFCLFGVLNQKMQGIDVSDDEDLKSEILMILQGIPSDELKKAFDHEMKKIQ